MIFPAALRPGDTIAVVAPSSPFEPCLAWVGLGFLAQRYRVLFDRGLFAQSGYLAGKRNESMTAIPQRLVEDVALVGPIEKVRDELPAWKASCLTTMLVSGPPQMLEAVAKLVL